ncbi:DNA polymerase subunit gamma-2, mitochondrial-like [Glandiceps talaboti]
MSNLEKLISLCSRHGFVYSTAEIPGKILAGSYVYGPLGTELRRNLQQQWWTSMVTSQDLIYGVDSSQLIYDKSGGDNGMLSISNPYQNNSANDQSSTAGDYQLYLQSSCHKGILYQYPAALKLLSYKLPFGLAEIGHCFRKNINNDNMDKFILNLPEFTQMSMQFFSPAKIATKWMDTWQRQRIIWWRKFAGNSSKFHLTDIKQSESQQTVEVQYEFPWGVDSIERITNRGDADLLELQKETGISVQGKFGRRTVTPVVIETTAGLDRGILAYLLDAHQEKERSDKGKLRTRQLLRFHTRIAPFKVAVVPVKNTRDLREISEHLARDLRKAGVNTLYVCEPQTSLEQQFIRFDEMGVPFTVVINEKTLKNGIIAMRNRDTTLKEQLHITEVTTLLLRNLAVE